MKTRKNKSEIMGFGDELDQLVHLSRRLGENHSLVLLGGGNTSAKVKQKDLFGREEDILYVKGSGTSLEEVDRSSFSPVRLNQVLPLLDLDDIATPELMNAFACAMTRAKAPTPSIETLLHALLPFPFVVHTHADSLLAVGNTAGGEEHIRQCYGDDVLVVPFRSSGFELAKCCAEAVRHDLTSKTVGIVLMHHGIFAFGHDAGEAYARTIELVERAENHLRRHGAWDLPRAGDGPKPRQSQTIAALRRAVSKEAGKPLLLTTDRSPEALAFARRPDLAAISRQGPATPHHAIFTKRVPLLGRDVAAFAAEYGAYLDTVPGAPQRIDPAPRVILDPDLGLCAAGVNAFYAAAAAEVYRHTIEIVSRATALDAYRALPPEEILAAELDYGGFEHKIRSDTHQPLAGEAALVVDAASPAGRACVAALLEMGAAAVGLGKEAENLAPAPAYLGISCDIQDGNAVAEALEQAVRRFGGIDMAAIPCDFADAPLLPILALSPTAPRLALLGRDKAALRVKMEALAARNVRANALLQNGDATAAGKLAAELCGPLFTHTSNALIPINS
jgi:Uncharacterized conserved protein